MNGLIVLLLLLTNVSLSLIQGRRAESALKKLKKNLQVTWYGSVFLPLQIIFVVALMIMLLSRVLREKEWKVVQDREVVPGDVVRLRHGDFVPAGASS